MPIERYMEEQMTTVGGKAIPSGLYTQKGREVARTDIPKKDIDKEETLEKATVTISTGKSFYADSASRSDMSDAIAIGSDLGQDSTMWKLAEPIEGSKWASVTMAEMKEARMMALEYKGSIIS